jgi:hypothetical protein
MDLTEALEVSVSELTESIVESPPTREQIRAFLEELRDRRAPIDRRIAAFRRAFGSQWLRQMDIDASAALMDSAGHTSPRIAYSCRHAVFVRAGTRHTTSSASQSSTS